MYQDPPPSYSQAIAVEPHIPSAPPGSALEPQLNHNPPYIPYPTQPQPQTIPQQPIQRPNNNKKISSPVPNNTANSSANFVITTQVINPNPCPACRVGMLEYDYTCLGICCAIVFFPVGIFCCLAMKNRRCAQCNAQF